MRRGAYGAGLMQSHGVVPTLPPAGRLIRLAMRFFCKSAGFDKLSQRPLAKLVEANGREATSFRSSCSSAPRRTTLHQPCHPGRGLPLQLNYVCYTAPVR